MGRDQSSRHVHLTRAGCPLAVRPEQGGGGGGGGEDAIGDLPSWSATLALTRDQALHLIQAENFACQVRLMPHV
jgi:hypothetical protein